MKNLLISSYLILCVSPFAFWSMEGSYGDSVSQKQVYKNPKPEQIKYFFIYDKHTCNQLKMTIDPVKDFKNKNKKWDNLVSSKAEVFKFLNCNFKYNEGFWKKSNLEKINGPFKMDNNPKRKIPAQVTNLIYRKQELLPIKNGLFEQDPKDKLTPPCCKPFTHYIALNKSFNSLSGVKINNTVSGVTLTKNGKSVDLTTTLRKYCNQNAKDIDMNDKELKLLNNSKILAVWCLTIRDANVIDKGGKSKIAKIEAQMLGLAEDKEGKLFHWTTDLKNDISALM